MTFSTSVQAVKLPTQQYVQGNAVVTGWGADVVRLGYNDS